MRISDWSSDVCSSDLQKLLHLTETGAELEAALFRDLREKMSAAYAQAGQGSVTGFWRVLAGLIPSEDRKMVAALQEIGRASCRERVCQYVLISVVAVTFTKKKKHEHNKIRTIE